MIYQATSMIRPAYVRAGEDPRPDIPTTLAELYAIVPRPSGVWFKETEARLKAEAKALKSRR